jgi:hypothetical protein
MTVATRSPDEVVRGATPSLAVADMSEKVSTGRQIAAAVMAWPGVEPAAHRFGGIEFRLGKRELGHLHCDALADLPFRRRVRDELVAT